MLLNNFTIQIKLDDSRKFGQTIRLNSIQSCSCAPSVSESVKSSRFLVGIGWVNFTSVRFVSVQSFCLVCLSAHCCIDKTSEKVNSKR